MSEKDQDQLYTMHALAEFMALDARREELMREMHGKGIALDAIAVASGMHMSDVKRICVPEQFKREMEIGQ